jgi:hypothetical protein
MSHQQSGAGPDGPKHPSIGPGLVIGLYVLAVACAGVAIHAAMVGDGAKMLAEVIASVCFLVAAITLTLRGPA